MTYPDWKIRGPEISTCNCNWGCPCQFNSIPTHGNCRAGVAMRIDEGHYGDTRLNGLLWSAMFAWPGAIHEGNGEALIILDERADADQQAALLGILSGQHGGPMFEVFASLVSTLLEPQSVPIEWTFDKARRHARLVVKGHGEAVAVPLTVPATGAEQRVIVQMPDGFEYHEIDVAQTAVLRGTGAIRFEHKGTNSNLALVDHSPRGLA